MQRKLNILQIVTLFAYLWVIATLPLHTHTSSADKDNHEYCTHSQSNKHTHQSSHEEDCVICLNLHTPAAINDIQIFETSVVSIDYYPCYHVDRAIIGYDHYTAQTSNKDPPHSIIS